MGNKQFSSSMEFDMDHEFIYDKYPYLHKEVNHEYGVSTTDEIVFRPVCFDELAYLLRAEGTHMILFGGSWSFKMQSAMDRINHCAKKYGVDTIHCFDFRCDGENEDTTFKADITAQRTYDGPGKRFPISLADCNYIYGELVTRYLTNLNDWVADQVGTREDITYLNLYQDAVTVPNLREPFLFLYNKDNRVDYSGAVRQESYNNDSECYPIIAAMEIECYRDESTGRLYASQTAQNEQTEIPDLCAVLEKKIFQYVGRDGNTITPYTHSDYIRDAYRRNGRGHAFKTQDAFSEKEPIYLQAVSWPMMQWLLSQKGTFLFCLGGPWCANTQAAVATFNDYAIANNVRIYMMDMRLDSKHPIDFWKYPRLNEMKLSSFGMSKYYFELWEKFLPGAPVTTSLNPNAPAWARNVTTTETDAHGVTHAALSVGVPYLFAYNKDTLSERGGPAPVLSVCQEMYELIDCSNRYVYHAPNYRCITAHCYAVFYAYCHRLGVQVQDISVDRTTPLQSGEPVRHVETVAYHKSHNWYQEFSWKYPEI